MLVAQFLEVVFVENFLIPRDSEYDLINDVGGVLQQKKKEKLKKM